MIEEVDVDKKAEEDDEYAEKHSNPSSEDEEGEEEIDVEQLEVSVFVLLEVEFFLTISCFVGV